MEHHNSTWITGKLIGKGSYGTVHLGIRQSDGGFFAVKSAGKDSISSVDALENEIRILRSLSSSPFIVEYYGDDETLSHRNLHLEYLSGGDVAKAGGIDDLDLIRSYTWCLVMALQTVHSHGIVHCDVKGSNALISAGVAKLADFGSAKMIDVDQGSKIVPRGSPLWMAPEVVRGESQGFKSDIWSLGCTVIEMLSGLPAWQDRGVHTLFKIGYSDELPEYPARLPELVTDFLNKCLNRDPSSRWSCDQLLQHPFLLPIPASKITVGSSPRSVIDTWPELDFSDNDHEFKSDQIPARDRISQLETETGANWESDGWVEVRSLGKKEEIQEPETGASSEYFNSDEGIEVIASLEGYDRNYPTSINVTRCKLLWINDDLKDGGDGGVDGRRSDGNGKAEVGVVSRENTKIIVITYLFILIFILYSLTNMWSYYIHYDNKNKLFALKDYTLYFSSLGVYLYSYFYFYFYYLLFFYFWCKYTMHVDSF